jgi:hypothetical protein
MCQNVLMDDKELASQMVKYADAITAFSFVQGTALALLVGQGGNIDTNIQSNWPVTLACILVSIALYIILIVKCQRAEDDLRRSEPNPSGAARRAVALVRVARLVITCLTGIGEIALVFELRPK